MSHEARGADLLEEAAVRRQLSRDATARLTALDILEFTDSTNSELLRRAPADRHGRVILADRQTAGRGRRGRRWHSPEDANIHMSVGWHFSGACSSVPVALGFLPLVVAVQACRALTRAGVEGLGIKWPNDILVNKQKLAGILIESSSEGADELSAVIGIGLNVVMPESGNEAIEQPWTDVASLTRDGVQCSRNALAGLLIDELLLGLPAFSESGFQPFRAAWRQWDLLNGRKIVVRQNAGEGGSCTHRYGFATGIGPQGGLLFVPGLGKDDGNAACPEQLLAAEVSIRHD